MAVGEGSKVDKLGPQQSAALSYIPRAKYLVLLHLAGEMGKSQELQFYLYHKSKCLS